MRLVLAGEGLPETPMKQRTQMRISPIGAKLAAVTRLAVASVAGGKLA